MRMSLCNQSAELDEELAQQRLEQAETTLQAHRIHTALRFELSGHFN